MKEYSITVPDGMATSVLLSDEDAKRAGLLSDEGVKASSADPAKQPENQPANSSGEKGGTAANKAGTAENK